MAPPFVRSRRPLQSQKPGYHGDLPRALADRLGRVLQSTDRQGREFATCHDAAMGAMGRRGRLAQLVERLLYTQDVGGSSPSPPTSSKGGRRLEAGREAAVIGAAIDAESAPETEIGL